MDYAGVGLGSNFRCGTNGQYWVASGTPKIIGTFGSAGQWFDTSVFSKPPAGTFNTQNVRAIIHQPGFENWNMGLFKAIPVNERFQFQFRAAAFNHPNWGGASGGGGRNIQLSLKLEF